MTERSQFVARLLSVVCGRAVGKMHQEDILRLKRGGDGDDDNGNVNGNDGRDNNRTLSEEGEAVRRRLGYR